MIQRSAEQINDTAQWGAQHNLPITLALPPIMGGAIVVSPGVSYSQVWVGPKIYRNGMIRPKKWIALLKKAFLWISRPLSV